MANALRFERRKHKAIFQTVNKKGIDFEKRFDRLYLQITHK